MRIRHEIKKCTHRDQEVSGIGHSGRKETAKSIARLSNIVSDALSESKGRWLNGKDYEYAFAYCSKCGRMQWAGWDTHKQAEKNIESFAHYYKFCPSCGAEMEGGLYVK